MKLAILAQTYLFDKTASINGTVVQLHNLSAAFVKNEVEVHYICSTKDYEKPATEINNGIHFHWIQVQKGTLDWKRQMPLYKEILEKVQPDAVYVRGRNVLQYLAGNYSQQYNKVYVWGTNGEDSAEFWKNSRRLKASEKNTIKKGALLPLKIYEDIFINKGMRMADYVVNQSNTQRSSTRDILKKDGVVLPSYFLPVRNVVKKENEILWLATLSPNKQPEIFIELLRDTALNDWKGVLGGGTSNISYNRYINSLVKELPIQITGQIEFEDSFQFYQRARLYVNTSRHDSDGLPNAYLQSWLSGTPVLSLHHDPNNWLQEKGIGYCGHGSIKKLREKIQELLNHPQEIDEMGKRAKLFAEEQFSSNRTIEAYIDLFRGNGQK